MFFIKEKNRARTNWKNTFLQMAAASSWVVTTTTESRVCFFSPAFKIRKDSLYAELLHSAANTLLSQTTTRTVWVINGFSTAII